MSFPSFSFSFFNFSQSLLIESSFEAISFSLSFNFSLNLMHLFLYYSLAFSSYFKAFADFFKFSLNSSSSFLYFLMSSRYLSFSCLSSSILVSNSKICQLFSSYFLMISYFCFMRPFKNCLSSPDFFYSSSTFNLSFSASSFQLASSMLNYSHFSFAFLSYLFSVEAYSETSWLDSLSSASYLSNLQILSFFSASSFWVSSNSYCSFSRLF